MTLKDVLSRLETGNEKEIEKVLLQYNQEVGLIGTTTNHQASVSMLAIAL